MTPDARRRAERLATKDECLANRIMALRETRCEAHHHYLCDVCAGQWIADAIAQAVKEREAEIQALRKGFEHTLALWEQECGGRSPRELAEEIARLREALKESRELWELALEIIDTLDTSLVSFRACHQPLQKIDKALLTRRPAPGGGEGKS